MGIAYGALKPEITMYSRLHLCPRDSPAQDDLKAWDKLTLRGPVGDEERTGRPFIVLTAAIARKVRITGFAYSRYPINESHVLMRRELRCFFVEPQPYPALNYIIFQSLA